MKNKILSIIFTAILCIAFLPVVASAAAIPDGDGLLVFSLDGTGASVSVIDSSNHDVGGAGLLYARLDEDPLCSTCHDLPLMFRVRFHDTNFKKSGFINHPPGLIVWSPPHTNI